MSLYFTLLAFICSLSIYAEEAYCDPEIFFNTMQDMQLKFRCDQEGIVNEASKQQLLCIFANQYNDKYLFSIQSYHSPNSVPPVISGLILKNHNNSGYSIIDENFKLLKITEYSHGSNRILHVDKLNLYTTITKNNNTLEFICTDMR